MFDEVYYERFAGCYLTHRFYFDLHPPLGDLLYGLAAWVLRIPGARLLAGEPAPLLRLLPATFGTLVVPLVYLLLRQLGATRKVAAFAGAMVLLDNALLVESRLILLDGFLIFFGLCALSLYLAGRKRRAARGQGVARMWWLAASALLAGFALSVKWTGASALGIIMAAWFVEAMLRRAPILEIAREGAVLVLVPAAVYLGAFAIHFALLTHSGPGDRNMSAHFQKQIIGSLQYDPSVHLSFWEKLEEVHHEIRYGNASLDYATNAGASKWYTWPIMKHPMGLWEAPRPFYVVRAGRRMIILIGNPLVWWGGMIGVLVGIAAFIARRERFSAGGFEYGFLILLWGVVLNFAPFSAIARLMYLYHYLFALVFVISLATYSTGVIAGWMSDDSRLWRFPSRRSATLYWVILGVVFASFLYFLPFTYGWHMSDRSWDIHFRLLHPL